jgi:hypothetical protein
MTITIAALLSLVLTAAYTGSPQRIPGQVELADFCTYGQLYGNNDATACVQAAIDWAFSKGGTSVHCPENAALNTSGTIYEDPPGNLRTSLTSPTKFGWTMKFWSGSGQAASAVNQCTIRPQSQGWVVWYIGPGRGVTLDGVAITGYNPGGAAGHNCGIDNRTTGVSISRLSSRASVNHVFLSGFYTAIDTGENGDGNGDSSTFFQNAIYSSCYAYQFLQTQAYVNGIYENTVLYTTNGVNAPTGVDVEVVGGNWSYAATLSNAFSISGTSGLTVTTGGGIGNYYEVTTKIASPDIYMTNGRVYNAFAIVTAHYGVVPLQLESWNSSTGVATFNILLNWSVTMFPGVNITRTTDIQDEIRATTTLYAVELPTVFTGGGVRVQGAHIEDDCGATYFRTLWTHSFIQKAVFRDSYLAQIGGLANYRPAYSPTAAHLACYYVGQTFPLFWVNGGDLEIDNVSLNNGTAWAADPFIIDNFVSGQDTPANFTVSRITAQPQGSAPFNVRTGTAQGGSYKENGYLPTVMTSALGSGIYDQNYFLSYATGNYADGFRGAMGPGSSRMIGFRPDPSVSPCIFDTDIVYGTLGSGTQTITGTSPNLSASSPILFGGQEYQICNDYNYPIGSDAYVPYRHFRSLHHFYTYGVNLPSNAWAAKGNSPFLYVADASLFFPGLGIVLTTDITNTYVVTGVYPGLGYVTVAEGRENDHNLIHGAAGVTYTGTLIGQEPTAITFDQVSIGTTTIGGLPTCNSKSRGLQGSVSNGVASPTYGGAVSTTGSTWDPVICNGTSWMYH